MVRRRIIGGLSEDQMVFDFFKSEAGKLIRKRKEKIKQRNRKQLSKRLLSWMDSDVNDIPPDVLHQLDALIESRKREVQSRWSAIEEAERKGLDTRNLNKLSCHDGRYFESKVNVAGGLDIEGDQEDF
jgi:hypothetical protein